MARLAKAGIGVKNGKVAKRQIIAAYKAIAGLSNEEIFQGIDSYLGELDCPTPEAEALRDQVYVLMDKLAAMCPSENSSDEEE